MKRSQQEPFSDQKRMRPTEGNNSSAITNQLPPTAPVSVSDSLCNQQAANVEPNAANSGAASTSSAITNPLPPTAPVSVSDSLCNQRAANVEPNAANSGAASTSRGAASTSRRAASTSRGMNSQGPLKFNDIWMPD